MIVCQRVYQTDDGIQHTAELKVVVFSNNGKFEIKSIDIRSIDDRLTIWTSRDYNLITVYDDTHGKVYYYNITDNSLELDDTATYDISHWEKIHKSLSCVLSGYTEQFMQYAAFDKYDANSAISSYSFIFSNYDHYYTHI